MSDNPLPMHMTLLYTSRLRGRIDGLPRLFSLLQRERAAAARISSTVIVLDLGESCVRDAWLCEATAGRALLVAMDAFGTDGFYLDRADPLSDDPQVLGKLRAVIVTPVFSEDQPLTFNKRIINADSDTTQPICVSGWDTTLPTNMTNVPYALTIRVSRHIPNSDTVRYDPQYDPDSQTLWVADPDEAGSESVGMTLGRITFARYSRELFQITHQRLLVTPDLPPDPTVSGVVDFVLAEAGYAARNASRPGQSRPPT
jgi:hypothetical protein